MVRSVVCRNIYRPWRDRADGVVGFRLWFGGKNIVRVGCGDHGINSLGWSFGDANRGTSVADRFHRP
jgi:hypothetical protein